MADGRASKLITKTVIDDSAKEAGAKPLKEYRIWDGDTGGVRGFGLRVKPSGTRSFFYQYALGKKRRITIGQYPALSIKKAREQAQKYAAQVLDGIDPLDERNKGDAPQTVSNLCDKYLERARKGLILYRGKPKKASTVQIDEGRVSRHIKPLLGKKRLTEITSAHVEAFRDQVAAGETATNIKTGPRGLARVTGGHGTAGRCVDLLGSIFSFANRNDYMTGENPTKGVDRLRGESRDRYLRPDEYKAFSDMLHTMEAEGKNKTTLMAFRLLALTGARRNEILALKRAEIRLDESIFEFADTKTGKQRRAFGNAAGELLRIALEPSKDKTFVFPGTRPGSHIQNTKLFRSVCERAGLEGVTPHVLRHSFATVAGELNYAEVTIGALLGHRQNTTTGRYTHAVDAAIIGAADKVSGTISGYMESGATAKRGEVVDMRGKAVT
jgi:integrase